MDGKNYALVTAAYWGFTLTDGALRMLVLLHFHRLGFTSVNLAFLFLLYEFFGVITNLVGGWIGSRFGLKITLFGGLILQVAALLLLSLTQESWTVSFSVAFVMATQALSGIAKDLTKMSSKSAVKLLVPDDNSANSQSTLFKLVAVLTGSKNALKGCGFFLGGVLLQSFGFRDSLWMMAAMLTVILVLLAALLRADMGRSKAKTKFAELFSKSRAINVLSLARFFLFGARDVWFVVGLPVFLASQLGWSFARVGGFLALWVIGYGAVQAITPKLMQRGDTIAAGVMAARIWGIALCAVTLLIALALQLEFNVVATVLLGLAVFGAVFAVNSSVHSYLILAYSDSDQVSLNVGFYYMSNACGRLIGTLLSGAMYLAYQLPGCMWVSVGMLACATVLTFWLPAQNEV